MDEYIKQMQEYLNKNSAKKDEDDILKEIENNLNNLNQNQEINDEDDLDFQQIINNNINLNTKIEEDNIPIKKEETKEIENKPKSKENNKNIDDIPLKKNNNLDFNELLEKELSKEQNEGNYNNEINKKEPKFKYIPKKKVDIVSVPTNTKKYKYYSDNFKQKKRRN